MSFNTGELKNALIAAFNAARENTTDAETAIEALSQAISNEVAAQVKACIDGATVDNSVMHVLVSPSGPVDGEIVVTTILNSNIS